MKRFLLLAPFFLSGCSSYLDVVCAGRQDKDLCYRQEAAVTACESMSQRLSHTQQNEAALAQCFLRASSNYTDNVEQNLGIK